MTVRKQPVDVVNEPLQGAVAGVLDVGPKPELGDTADVIFESASRVPRQSESLAVHEETQDDLASTWRHNAGLLPVQPEPGGGHRC
ncbi:hypothetical protein [Streptomyces sp. Tu102]|uniref:hypothetical protein n=1 Tax=Streptomyces sp. Tu102 TaxID=2838019 RepID=UPI00202A0DDD|nr:hypothetical protein [Streptomyces sp. Tu102]